MQNEPNLPDEDPTITLEGEDGQSYSCQILDIFEFENQEYALLLKQAEDGGEEEALVIMRHVQRDDQSIFQTIESDEEFDKVVAFVEELAKQTAQVPQGE